MTTKGRSEDGRIPRAALALAACLALPLAAADPPSRFPTIPAERTHTRALVEDAMHYVAPSNKIVDPASGYPFEGWNHDPSKGLFLRSFTQLTAIGQYLELLADVVAGYADTPDLPRDRALAGLTHLVATLRRDQHDPKLAARGLLVNFLDLGGGKRVGPLAGDTKKADFLAAFGPEKGEGIWKAMMDKGWVVPRKTGRAGEIRRSDTFGYEHFDGPLAPYRDDATRQKVMQLLDRRVVLVVFGDNANLSTSAAKAIGALLEPAVASKPEVVAIRRELEAFLDDQKEGYAHLYDPKVGLFNFGWDASEDLLFGWEDAQGKWVTGHMDYFVNEFRGPATFVAARFGLPPEAIGNLGLRIKPYTTREGETLHVLAPWEGSAFQAMGLTLSLDEAANPSWRELLGNAVAVEVDYAERHGLPGFLSESYSGRGTQYTGAVGIPEITVSPKPRITDAPSLYTLGVASTIDGSAVERFLAASRTGIEPLLTDHGPWEGFNTSKKEVIRFQTSAHTLSLILGLLGTGPANMRRYAEHAGIADRLAEHFRPGAAADLLDEGRMNTFAWTGKDAQLRSGREGSTFRARGEGIALLGVAFVAKSPDGVDLSGGRLRLRYRSKGPVEPVTIQLKPAGVAPDSGLITKEIATRFADTAGEEAEVVVPLPATVGLRRIKEVVLSYDQPSDRRSIDLTITGFDVTPIGR